MQQFHFGAIALGTLTVLCWSSYNVAAKSAIDNGTSPELLTFLRFSIPGMLALPVLALRLRRRDRHPVHLSLWRMFVLILLGGPLFGLVAFSGYAFAPLSHGLLFAPVAVFLTATLGGIWVFKSLPQPSVFAGAAVMFAGLAVLVGFDLGNLPSGWPSGALRFVMAGAMWGSFTVLLKRWQIPMFEGALYLAIGSSLLALPLLGNAFWTGVQEMPARQLWAQAVLQGGIGGTLSVAAMIGAVRLMTAQTAALLPSFTPATALLLSALLERSLPSAAEAAGVVLVSAGFLLAVCGPPWRSHFAPSAKAEAASGRA